MYCFHKKYVINYRSDFLDHDISPWFSTGLETKKRHRMREKG